MFCFIVTLPIINEENFPDWLLNLSEASGGGPLQISTELHAEPHYYCQGDGLGNMLFLLRDKYRFFCLITFINDR